MSYQTIIEAEALKEQLGQPDWVLVDCRFSLADPHSGRANYLKGHIPGAVYAHLDEDLSGSIIPGETGRHPLPDAAALAEKLSAWGIDERVQVVAYDDMSGALAAARLWWLLRWLGHTAVAVLNGGIQAWQRCGYELVAGQEGRSARIFTPRLQDKFFLTTQQVEETRLDPAYQVLDARAYERYLGKNEMIDPVAGHIPGALSLPYTELLDGDGKLKPAEHLHTVMSQRMLGRQPENAVFYCGSGVTAALNILAMEHAGLGQARLYAGSWSEWITDPARPVETEDPKAQ